LREFHFVLSLLDSARSKPHQFAFDPSRDASADSGVLLGLAAFVIPRSLLLERRRQRDVSDRFMPPNQLRTTAPVLSVLEMHSHAIEENGVSRRSSSLRRKSPGFRRGVFALLRPFAFSLWHPSRSLDFRPTISSGVRRIPSSQGRFFSRSVKNAQDPTTQDAFLRWHSIFRVFARSQG